MSPISSTLRLKVDSLPIGPGVYLWKDARGKVLYIGKAKNLRARVRSYLQPEAELSPKNRLLVSTIHDVETIVVPTEPASLLLENTLIKEYQPRFNVRLRDDKSYPSIVVTVQEPFPRVLVTRDRTLRGARYFGPFTDVSDMRTALSVVRRIFTVRSCHDDLPRERRERPCLDYHIGRCKAPCVGWQGQANYRAMIQEVLQFLEGQTVDVRTRLRQLMSAASDRQDYESAKDMRDTLRWLEQVEIPSTVDAVGTGDADVIGFARDGEDAVGVYLRVRQGQVSVREHRFLENLGDESDAAILSAFVVRYYLSIADRARKLFLPFPPDDAQLLEPLLESTQMHVPRRGTGQRWTRLADQNAQHLMESFRIESFDTTERSDDPVYALGRDLGLTAVPRRIACVDISTNQGRDTVGALVVFEAGRPKKSEYRKFRIKGPGQQDDFAAIREVVDRYFSRRLREGGTLPDLLVIDGGKGQVGAAREALATAGVSDQMLIGLAKREEEIFLPGRQDAIRLPRRSASLRLLQRIRDETHRFGVTYNRKRRTHRTLTSELLSIPGVGPSRRRTLLNHFGSLAGVRSASPGEIAALPGFSKTLAERIHQHLLETTA